MSDAHESSYALAGVDYSTLDAAKRTALRAAASTSANAAGLGALLVDRSRGESAVVIDLGVVRLGFVLECLGTKSMIARSFADLTGEDHFDAIGYDTVAAVVNDCCCVGALPFVVNAYFATGAASFYSGGRHRSLIEGFRRGCDDAGAAWGGGESPTLSGLVAPLEIDLAGSAIGRIPDGTEPILGEELAAGDEIVFVSSSGLHANGASLVRQVAAELADGLASELPSGRRFGEAVLDPSHIYTPLVARLLGEHLDVTYLSHITGHGLRKVMRADAELTYSIDRLPEVPEVLTFLADRAGLSAHEAYGTLNMGVGFAVFVRPGQGERVVAAAAALGLSGLVAGATEAGPRRVVLSPVGVEFNGDELDLR